MELISREALITKIKPWIDDNDPVLNGYGVIEAIEDFPTIESRPKGKWIVDRYCSSCEWDKNDFDYIGGWRENFCPCCGADMRGEEQ